MSNDNLNIEKLVKALGESIFANNIILHQSVDSTNLFAKKIATYGAPEGSLILAEEQTAGRGRKDRRWLSEGYKNILLSIILRPLLKIDEIFVLTMILAIAVIDAIKELTGLNAMIKWPNDIYIGNKKAGGILTEFSGKGRDIKYIVLGLGLNVNWQPGREEDLIYPVTSLLSESGKETDRNELLICVLKVFDLYYKEAESGKIGHIYEKWNKNSLLTGREVEIKLQGETITGKVIRVDRKGALIIEETCGKERRILNGDVSLRI